MGLYETIYKLQQKPEREKKKILVIMVFASFILIVGLWLVIFKSQLASGGYFTFGQDNGFDQQEERAEDNMPGPIDSLKDGASFIFSDLVNITTDFLETTNQDVPVPQEIDQTEPKPIYKLPTN